MTLQEKILKIESLNKELDVLVKQKEALNQRMLEHIEEGKK